MFEASEVKRLIEQGLPCELVVIEGEDGVHFRGIVVSAAFEGKQPFLERDRAAWRKHDFAIERQMVRMLLKQRRAGL